MMVYSSRDEILAIMQEDKADVLRDIANFIEKYEMDYKDVCSFLRETSDELDAETIVLRLRDQLKTMP